MADQYVVEAIRRALAEDRRTGVLDVGVTVAGTMVFVTGTAGTAEHLAAIAEVVGEVVPVGDLHIGLDSVGTFEHHLDRLASHADALLLAGDLTRVGDPAEAAVLAGALADLEGLARCGRPACHSDQIAAPGALGCEDGSADRRRTMSADHLIYG